MAVFDSYSSRSSEIFFNEIYKSSKQINSQKTSQSILFMCRAKFGTNQLNVLSMFSKIYRYFWRFSTTGTFSYPEPFLRAVNGARQGALAKSISNWHLIGYNEGYCSNNVYILLPCFYGIRFWIWPEPLVAPRVRRALGTRMPQAKLHPSCI